ncbi:hypothetical protein [Humidesulfovibrio idahonensis]
MRMLTSLLLLLALAGCALRNAGVAEYRLRPYLDANGTERCCEVSIINGKEIANLEAVFTRAADGSCRVELRETGVQAFEGQKIAADALRQTINDTVAIAVKAALAGGL